MGGEREGRRERETDRGAHTHTHTHMDRERLTQSDDFMCVQPLEVRDLIGDECTRQLKPA